MSGNITIGGEDLGTADPWEAILALSRRLSALRAENDSLRELLNEAGIAEPLP